MEDLKPPKCLHTYTILSGTWQADKDARVMCQICGSDILLTKEQVAEWKRLHHENPKDGAIYLAGLLPD